MIKLACRESLRMFGEKESLQVILEADIIK